MYCCQTEMIVFETSAFLANRLALNAEFPISSFQQFLSINFKGYTAIITFMEYMVMCITRSCYCGQACIQINLSVNA